MSGPVGGGKSKSTATVRVVTLDEFLDGWQLRLVPYNASWWTKIFKLSAATRSTSACLPPGTVIANAEYLLDKPWEFGDYRLLTNNCDIFAVYCKTGKRQDITRQFPLLPATSS